MVKTLTIDYRDGDVVLEGFVAYPEAAGKKPAVMVVHDWSGKNEFACHKAQQLAELGYIGFAIDIYGKGKIGKTKEEKSALMQPYFQDRALLKKRLLAAFETAKKLDQVDTSRLGVIGFCFGGLCALDLARSGADIKAVVSFHGLFHAPENLPKNTIKASLLVLHGFDDPMVTSDQVMTFGNEMTHANVDWQLTMYSQTKHAFMNPEANDPGFGTVYNKQTESRAWVAMKTFFKEIFE